MNQIVIGAAIPFLIGIGIRVVKRKQSTSFAFLVTWPISMAAGAFWAVIPDVPRLLGRQDLYLQLLNDPRTNIFFFHYTIDQIETDSPWWIPAFLFMALCVWFVAWQELKRQETP